MATIETRRNKSGDITSYRIVVCAGYDSKGTKILRRKTWKPDPQKTQRQNDKALQKAAALFEQSVEQGYQLDLSVLYHHTHGVLSFLGILIFTGAFEEKDQQTGLLRFG